MKARYLAFVCLLPFSMLYAQFSVDFTDGEGYSNGRLPLSPDWQVYDASGKDSHTFTVDTAESGRLMIDPTESAFQVAAYHGAGSKLTSNTYYVVSTFRLIYPEGSSSVIGNPIVLPAYEIQSATSVSELVSFGLRQLPDRGSGGNQFNLFTLSKLNGSNDPKFSTMISGEALGLSTAGSEKWADGTSDLLVLLYSLIHEGDGQWVEKILLVNVETSARIATFSRAITDSDNSFAESPQRFRLYGLHMSTVDVAVGLESISLKTAKE